MPDWEDDFSATDEREILEDECNGDCDYCPYKGIRPQRDGWTVNEFTREAYYCTLFDHED